MADSFLAQSSERIPAISNATVKVIRASADEGAAAGVLTAVIGAFGVQTVVEVLQSVLVEADQVYSVSALRDRIMPVLDAYKDAAAREGIVLPTVPTLLTASKPPSTGQYL